MVSHGRLGHETPTLKGASARQGSLTKDWTHVFPHTVAVTAGRPAPDADAPLQSTGRVRLDVCGESRCGDGSFGYGRDGNPTWPALEDAIGALEGGRALAFACGMAAAYAVLELVEPGARGGVPTACYLGVADASDEQRGRASGWTLRRVDIADTEGLLAAADGAG